jgi:prolyl-tRNA editing enzyme YbaK/EbsC (Cys-tRNA(Pro) deacylase)
MTTPTEIKRLKIFVASSLEAKDEDKFIRTILEENNIDAVTWKDIFHSGEFNLDSLLNITQRVHGAIIISTCDDKIWYRGTESMAPRDNILFEMGLFIKALGTKHVALVFCKNEKGESPKTPTDIQGLNVILFDKVKKAANETHLEKWLHKFKQVSHPMYFHLNDALSILRENFHKIPESWIDEIKNYILQPFEEMSKGALLGEFSLNTNQYYDSILIRLELANSDTKIRAVSLVAPDVWLHDPHQKRFFEFNVKAKKNGAIIQRLFIATDEQIAEHWSIIQEQIKNGFEIKTIHPRVFSDYPNLDDSIMFETPNYICCYRTIQFYDNPFKLKGAKLQLNISVCKEQAIAFDKVWKVAKEPTHAKFQTKKNKQPPGLSMKSYQLDHEVDSCEKAAAARKVPLGNELKTLILQTPSGFVAAHLPGDGELNLRAIKNTLEIKDIKIAATDQIALIGLESGTVSAILNPVWEMPHLISKRLLSLSYVTTNNKTKTGYFKFDPIILMEANSTILGNFERQENDNDEITSDEK